ncbi:SLAP domain-containing protein [Clostridium botulinum]|uniref:SLAP domain-containing protein n=1 Tax=Clostridium botulinum TaxID=1491 RepID=UPI000692417B|nr:SLAP domain-containing protein [Clostridium botulinum]KOC47287.1 hypothetical protein ADU88_10770 [Clostridium botulinum]NFO99235.1 SLAP domain-containing protein [Clostridium botulinum]OOV50586.1 SLAP domain-containing protein [Clostridium botulinum D/C]OOV54632.1 SLAP domain-containing protein [Clostridium botulinum D/C]OOV55032.1 SLAP domain-containing protein [Clostridium botulinum D/C]
MNTERKNVNLRLSFEPEREQIISKVQKEIVEEELKSLEPVKENDINISTTYVFDMGDKLEASIFFRNGLLNSINFDKVPLTLIDSKGKEILTEIFYLREVGNIPPKSARPWKLYFNKKDISNLPNTLEKCKVIFSSDIKALSTVDTEFENIPQNINMNLHKKFNEYLKALPIIEKGQITFNTYEVKLKDDSSIVITIIVRNGTKKNIKVEKLPIALYDANDKKICSVTLDINNLTVSPLKAKIYNLVLNFDPEKYLEYDFEKLSVQFEKE